MDLAGVRVICESQPGLLMPPTPELHGAYRNVRGGSRKRYLRYKWGQALG